MELYQGSRFKEKAYGSAVKVQGSRKAEGVEGLRWRKKAWHLGKVWRKVLQRVIPSFVD